MPVLSTVSNRCVFYLSGFDPKGAGHYHALYRTEAERQCAFEENSGNGWQMQISKRRKQRTGLAPGNTVWQIEAAIEGHTVHTHYEFMAWDAVVRSHWPKNAWALVVQTLKTTAFYVRHGTLWRMFLVSWPSALAAFLPFALLCALGLGIPLLSLAAGGAIAGATGLVALGWGAGLALAGVLALAGRWLQQRYSTDWVVRSYAFTAAQATNRTPELEARLNTLAEQVALRILAQADDEILVVGHSSGAIMAAIVLARALERLARQAEAKQLLHEGRSRVALLTLGQCIPLLGLLPMARQFRSELQTLADARGLAWTDFSAPSDGCCFALNDPLQTCGIAPTAEARPGKADGAALKILNPHFASFFDAETYKTLKRDRLRLHFQYLHALGPTAPGGYNYFAITAGPQILQQRFAAQPSITNYRGLRPFG